MYNYEIHSSKIFMISTFSEWQKTKIRLQLFFIFVPTIWKMEKNFEFGCDLSFLFSSQNLFSSPFQSWFEQNFKK